MPSENYGVNGMKIVFEEKDKKDLIPLRVSPFSAYTN